MRIVYTGAPYSGRHMQGKDAATLFQLSGRNSGNLLIGTAIMRQLDFAEMHDFTLDPKVAEQECDIS